MISKNEGNLGFTFQKGPIFHSLVLADEINRTTPKTQSALLEAMQEKTVTAGTTTYPLPEPFFVLVTENLLEMEGTYPLPEAQLDRFMFKLKIYLPDREDLSRILDMTTGGYSCLPTLARLARHRPASSVYPVFPPKISPSIMF